MDVLRMNLYQSCMVANLRVQDRPIHCSIVQSHFFSGGQSSRPKSLICTLTQAAKLWTMYHPCRERYSYLVGAGDTRSSSAQIHATSRD
jgi:hypothetical protein